MRRSNEIAVKVLVVDVGGSHVKYVTADRSQPARFKSGMKLTPQRMMKKLLELTAGWEFDAVSIGYPGVVRRGEIAREPHTCRQVGSDSTFVSPSAAPSRSSTTLPCRRCRVATVAGRCCSWGLGPAWDPRSSSTASSRHWSSATCTPASTPTSTSSATRGANDWGTTNGAASSTTSWKACAPRCCPTTLSWAAVASGSCATSAPAHAPRRQRRRLHRRISAVGAARRRRAEAPGESIEGGGEHVPRRAR